MSTFTTAGFFGLTSGCHICTEVAKTNGSTQGVYYIHYITSVNCSVSGPISAELRKYSPPNDTVLADNTIAFVIAKVYVPPANVPGNILLEAIHIAPVPGDPTSEAYEDSVPDFRFPAIFAHGCVINEHQEEKLGVVTFPMVVSDYIRGGTKQSTLQYVYHNVACDV